MPAGVNERANLPRLEQRRRPAAKVDRVGRGAACPERSRGARRNLAQQRGDIPLLQIRVEQTSVEVAVVADRRAEGNMDVEPEHWSQFTRPTSPARLTRPTGTPRGLLAI